MSDSLIITDFFIFFVLFSFLQRDFLISPLLQCPPPQTLSPSSAIAMSLWLLVLYSFSLLLFLLWGCTASQLVSSHPIQQYPAVFQPIHISHRVFSHTNLKTVWAFLTLIDLLSSQLILIPLFFFFLQLLFFNQRWKISTWKPIQIPFLSKIMSSVHSSSLQMLLAKELDEILYLMLGIDFESWIRYFSGPKICSLVSDQQLVSHFTRSSPTFDYFLSLFSCMSMTCIFEHPLRSQYIKWKDFETTT